MEISAFFFIDGGVEIPGYPEARFSVLYCLAQRDASAIREGGSDDAREAGNAAKAVSSPI